MFQFRQLICISAMTMFCFAEPAASADLGGSIKDAPAPYAETAPRSQWTHKFTTYAWLPWISGDVTVRGRPFAVEATPGDVLSALDWSGIPAWMSYFEARNGRLALFNDIVYSKLAGSGDFAAGRPGGVLALNGAIEADYTQAVIEVGAAYEIWSGASAGAGTHTAVDLLGGARYWYQNTSLSASLNVIVPGPGLIIDGNRAIVRSGTIDWLDPFIGARVRYQMAPGRLLTVRGDIGGFGIGSDVSWHAIGTYEFKLFERTGYDFDAYIGYKALSVDYSEGSGNRQYRYDAVQHGPVLGGTLRF